MFPKNNIIDLSCVIDIIKFVKNNYILTWKIKKTIQV